MDGNETEQERINRMYREKQNRIAKQTALNSAVQTVLTNPASQIKEPTIIANKILEVAEIYLEWIENSNNDNKQHNKF